MVVTRDSHCHEHSSSSHDHGHHYSSQNDFEYNDNPAGFNLRNIKSEPISIESENPCLPTEQKNIKLEPIITKPSPCRAIKSKPRFNEYFRNVKEESKVQDFNRHTKSEFVRPSSKCLTKNICPKRNSEMMETKKCDSEMYCVKDCNSSHHEYVKPLMSHTGITEFRYTSDKNNLIDPNQSKGRGVQYVYVTHKTEVQAPWCKRNGLQDRWAEDPKYKKENINDYSTPYQCCKQPMKIDRRNVLVENLKHKSEFGGNKNNCQENDHNGTQAARVRHPELRVAQRSHDAFFNRDGKCNFLLD